jgi:hypothetical protein
MPAYSHGVPAVAPPGIPYGSGLYGAGAYGTQPVQAFNAPSPAEVRA